MRNPSESEIDWEKGLIPAVIQDCSSKRVLMVGYMNKEAINKRLKQKKSPFSPDQSQDFGRRERVVEIFLI